MTHVKKVLMICNAFPPINSSGVVRTAKFAKYLSRMGWHVSVLTCNVVNTGKIDLSLLKEVESARIHRAYRIDFAKPWEIFRKMTNKTYRDFTRTGKIQKCINGKGQFSGIKRYIFTLLQLPDSYSGWILPAALKGLHVLHREEPQVLFSSAPYSSSHLIALILKIISGKPWVADFRDPWIVEGADFHNIPFQSLQKLNAALERQVINHADTIISNTDRLRSDFVRRYPNRSANDFRMIPNGYDQEDFESLTINKNSSPKTVISHVGRIYWKRDIAPFLRSIQQLVDQHPQIRGELEVRLIGSIRPVHRHILDSIIDNSSLREIVKFIDFVPRKRALEYLYESHILLLLGIDGPGSDLQVPAKLFEYLKAGKPILALCPQESAIVDTLVSAQASYIRADSCDDQQIGICLKEMITNIRGSDCSTTITLNLEAFSRKHHAKMLGQLLESCSK